MRRRRCIHPCFLIPAEYVVVFYPTTANSGFYNNKIKAGWLSGIGSAGRNHVFSVSESLQFISSRPEFFLSYARIADGPQDAGYSPCIVTVTRPSHAPFYSCMFSKSGPEMGSLNSRSMGQLIFIDDINCRGENCKNTRSNSSYKNTPRINRFSEPPSREEEYIITVAIVGGFALATYLVFKGKIP